MGVHGLWRLVEPAGRRISLHSLHGRTLAVDISIWLHQIVKGFQDSKNKSVPNAHLLGLFQRLCKLLYYGIRPVFVFDGGFPSLKRQTIINRQNKKFQMHKNADKVKKQLLETMLKHAAVNSVFPNSRSPSKSTKPPEDDLFKLPVLQQKRISSDSDESEDEPPVKKSKQSKFYHMDIHSVDVNSDDFKNLSAREKHDVLLELKETRKQSSWGRINEIPNESSNFSDYQMKRLLKRRQFQTSLEDVESEIGGTSLSLHELEILLNEEGIDTKINSITTRQIASNENAHYLLVKNIKEAVDNATNINNEKNDITNINNKVTDGPSDIIKDQPSISLDSEIDYISSENDTDDDLKKAIKLSMQSVDNDMKSDPINYNNDGKNESSYVSFENSETLSSDDDNDDNLKKVIELSLQSINCKKNDEDNIISGIDCEESIKYKSKDCNFALAKAYMMEYSGLSEYDINKILVNNLKEESHKNIALKNENANKYINEIYSNCNVNSCTEIKSNVNLSHNVEEGDFKHTQNNTIPDSDESFEDVPDIATNNQSNVENDIFADVFIDKSKFNILRDNIIKNVINSKTSPKENSISENKKECIGQNSKIHAEDFLEKDEKKIKNIEGKDENEISSINNTEKNIDSVVTNCVIEDSLVKPKVEKKLQSFETRKGPVINEDIINAITNDLEKQKDLLEMEQNKIDRMGRNISDEMTKDTQDLLKLFGIPYVIAPMEAEAQCAFLETIKLTDGTITDDSDIWLFGGKTVYRNFFNQQKQVLQFLSGNIERSFRLQRQDFILLALLVGSDYTLGVSGIGPVTALEILAAFSTNKIDNKAEIKPPFTELLLGLKNFKEWLAGTDNKFVHPTLRKKLKNISLSEEFPSHRVVEAYLFPNIDNSKETFSWGKPDLVALRDYTKQKFGWPREKTDEILNPIMKTLENKSNQLLIDSFFKTELIKDDTLDKISKRVKKAVDFMNQKRSDKDDGVPEISNSIKKNNNETKAVKKNKEKKTKSIRKNKRKIESINETQHDIKSEQFLKDNSTQEKLEVFKKINSCEIIPQKEKNKSQILENKLKAIEIFRKSKQGPGFVKKRKRKLLRLKDDAELSESGSSSAE